MNNLLKKARTYEAEHKSEVDAHRPSIHFSPMVGWCNDPNGFSVYKNEYHLFYQYYPYDVIWGSMHWGHAKTKDFITWEYLPAVMAPDQEYDSEGCFSGGATELDDGRQMLIYTGCYHRHDSDCDDTSDDTIYQSQCIAVGDGINYEKLSENPVIIPDTLSPGHSIIDFRDPKIWKEGDTYYLVLVNRIADESGVVLLYQSMDGFHWEFVTELDGSDNAYGTMWECPDFFSLDNQKVLVISAHEMEDDGQEFHAGYGNIAILGDYDEDNHKFTRESIRAIDHGTDFYAPQTLLTPDGRRIMIAWMQNWSNKDYKGVTGQHFFGEMTIPRELTIRDGHLCQNPVRELAAYYGTSLSYENVIIKDELSLEGIGGKCYDMTLSLFFDGEEKDFTVTLCDDGKHKFILSYDAKHGIFTGDRNRTGIRVDQINARQFHENAIDGSFKIRFIVDRYSIEIFINDGACAASFILNTPGTGVTFRAESEMRMNVDFHEIISGK